MRTKAYLLGGICALAMLCAGSAQASFDLTITQVGSNVVETGAGTIDTAGLTYQFTGSTSSYIWPSIAYTLLGPAGSVDFYTGTITGPGNFGSGPQTYSSFRSGDTVGIAGSSDALAVPAGYVSGNPLADSTTFANATFMSLGLTPGVYVYDLPSDTFTVDIGVPVPTPEPASVALLAGIVGMIGAGLWKKAPARAKLGVVSSASAPVPPVA